MRAGQGGELVVHCCLHTLLHRERERERERENTKSFEDYIGLCSVHNQYEEIECHITYKAGSTNILHIP